MYPFVLHIQFLSAKHTVPFLQDVGTKHTYTMLSCVYTVLTAVHCAAMSRIPGALINPSYLSGTGMSRLERSAVRREVAWRGRAH